MMKIVTLLGRCGVALAALVLIPACGSDDDDGPAPGTRRVLSMYANPRTIPGTPENAAAAADLAYEAGARGWIITYSWFALEPIAGTMQLVDLAQSLAAASDQRGLTVFLGIQLINTVAKEVPADLRDVRFDAPEMKARFHGLIDAIAPLVRGRVTYLAIGNEVDFYLDYIDTSDGWAAYRDFYADAVAYVHEKLPGVQVGVAVTYLGASTTARVSVRELTAVSDVAIFTYYPVDLSGVFMGIEAIDTALPDMVALAGGKPVVLQEIGCAAAAVSGSSEAIQAEFVTRMMARWTAIDARDMPFLNFFHLHDFSGEFLDFLVAYYGAPGSEDLKAYLGSLGVRRSDGTPKPGWDALVRGARDAGLP